VMAVVVVLLVVVLGVWVSVDKLRAATRTLNLLLAGLVLYNLAALIFSQIQTAQATQQAQAKNQGAETRAPKVNNDSQHPDIYYIILDGYPSNSSLMEESEIDNSDFTDGLEERGFYVAYDSRTNYPVTLPSKLSSLNMRYLEPGEGPDGMPGIEYARALVADNAVAKELISRGYTYVFMLSGYDTGSTIADLNIDYYSQGTRYFPLGGPQPDNVVREPFWPLLVESTALVEADLDLAALSRPASAPAEYRNPYRVLAVLDEAPRIAQMPEATFAVLHIIMPHYPIRFRRDGSILTGEEYQLARNKNRKPAFVDQLIWFNGRVLQMVDSITSSSSTRRSSSSRVTTAAHWAGPMPDVTPGSSRS